MERTISDSSYWTHASHMETSLNGEDGEGRGEGGDKENKRWEPLVFSLVSFGYMFPWTVIGSQVNTLSETFGNTFFVYLNIAFYISGLPTSIIQKCMDGKADNKYSSQVTYTLRTVLPQLAQIVLVLMIPRTTYEQYIVIAGLLGVCTWAVHGSTTKLAAMVENKSATYLQMGFVAPAMLSLVLVLTIPPCNSEQDRWELYVLILI